MSTPRGCGCQSGRWFDLRDAGLPVPRNESRHVFRVTAGFFRSAARSMESL